MLEMGWVTLSADVRGMGRAYQRLLASEN